MWQRCAGWLLGSCALWALGTGTASAQNLDTLSLSGGLEDDKGTFELESPWLGHPDAWYLGLALAYADDPVVIELEDGTEQSLLQAHLAVHVLGGYTVLGRVRVDVDAPLYPRVTLMDQNTWAIGDLRLSATIPIWAHEASATGFALSPQVTAPSGTPDLYVSDEGFTAGLTGVAGGTVLGIGWAANLGVEYAPRDVVGDVTQGVNLFGGAGVHYRFNEIFLAGVELDSILTLAGGLGPYNKNPVEVHGYGTFLSPQGFRATLGAGTGIVAGVGAPDWRVVVGIGWGAPGAPPDLDGDGLPDVTDGCPELAEDLDGFQDEDGCPDLDNDEDGISDPEDACPDEPEDFDGWDDVDGCPDPDNDFDGLADGDDICPDVAGALESFGCPDRDFDGVWDHDDECPDDPGEPALAGCPDRDGDLVPDFRDACPDKPVPVGTDTSLSDGCPDRVVVGMRRIIFDEHIFFGFNHSNIHWQSYDLLYAIADTIVKYPELKLIEVGGHTDWIGSHAYNERLSWRRATSVVRFLEDRAGVPGGVLRAHGYGETQPIDTNETDEGRARNRRVDFTIEEQEEVELTPGEAAEP